MQWFEEINRALPEIRVEDYRNESDFYGASEEIAKSLGLPRAPLAWATWAHGWRFFEPRFVEHYTWNHAPERPLILVLRDDEKELLQENGYPSTFSVGAPFLYATPMPMRRLEKSLLIMPVHSLDYAHSKVDYAAYFQAIDPHLSSFDHVAACIHPSCLRRGAWIEEIDRRGIPYFSGVEIRNRNGLARIKSLMSAFTHVTSNWLGAHLPYAAHCGCSISIYGPRPKMSIHDHWDDPFYKAYPHVLEWFYDLVETGHFERQYAPFFRPPGTTVDDRAWAAEQLGEKHRRTPQEIARLFHWAADFRGDEQSLEATAWAAELGWKSDVEFHAMDYLSQTRQLQCELNLASKRIANLENWIAKLQQAAQRHRERHRNREEVLQKKTKIIVQLESQLLARNEAPANNHAGKTPSEKTQGG